MEGITTRTFPTTMIAANSCEKTDLIMEGITTCSPGILILTDCRREKTDLIMEGITTLVLLPMSKPISRRENWPDYGRDYDHFLTLLNAYDTSSRKLTWLWKGLRQYLPIISFCLNYEKTDLIMEGITTIIKKVHLSNSLLWRKLTWLWKGLRHDCPVLLSLPQSTRKLTWLWKGLRHLKLLFIRTLHHIRENWPDYGRDYDTGKSGMTATHHARKLTWLWKGLRHRVPIVRCISHWLRKLTWLWKGLRLN